MYLNKHTYDLTHFRAKFFEPAQNLFLYTKDRWIARDWFFLSLLFFFFDDRS